MGNIAKMIAFKSATLSHFHHLKQSLSVSTVFEIKSNNVVAFFQRLSIENSVLHV